jgi:hypothetical protein
MCHLGDAKDEGGAWPRVEGHPITGRQVGEVLPTYKRQRKAEQDLDRERLPCGCGEESRVWLGWECLAYRYKHMHMHNLPNFSIYQAYLEVESCAEPCVEQ